MPLLEISVVPVGTNSASFSSYVSDAVRMIEEKGLNYQVTPTATVLEGDIDELMEVAKAVHQNALNYVDRVITNISIDDRKDKSIGINDQVQAVQQSLSFSGVMPEY